MLPPVDPAIGKLRGVITGKGSLPERRIDPVRMATSDDIKGPGKFIELVYDLLPRESNLRVACRRC
jgi:hypothetical protein